MSSSNSEFDYDVIVKKLIKKDNITGKLEDEKNALELKYWATLGSYYESKGKFELDENDNNLAKTILSNKSKMRNNVDREHAALDQKLESLQQLDIEMKANRENQSDIFFNNLELLYAEFKKLPGEFDNENMHLTIKNLKKSLNMYDLQIVDGNDELEILKNYIENFETVADLTDLNVVTEIIQAESLEKSGNPLKIQHRLSEVRRNQEFLLKKMQYMKVKYGIQSDLM